MKINEETTVSEEQVLFNKLNWENQQMILRIMRCLQPCELSCEVEEEKKIPTLNDIRESYGLPKIEEKKIPEKLNIEDDGNTITLFSEKENEWTILDNVDIIICNKINEIIDYLKSKGE